MVDSIQIGRYPMSVILSFLAEVDGTCFLLTQRSWTTTLLPLFRLRSGILVGNARHRHCYRVIPVQDPEVLLDRLNTRRLGQRKRQWKNATPSNHGSQKNEHPCDTSDPSHPYSYPCYEYNQTTSQISLTEWNRLKERQRDTLASPSFWPAHLQLLRFLSRADPSWHRSLTLLASYPRSGNTLLRSLLERTTGIVTGSDTRPDRPLSKSLALDFDLVGEGVTNTRQTPIVKTHFPERTGYPSFDADRVILLVRNPFDAIDSYWNLNLTNTHTDTVVDEVYDRFRDKFHGLAKNEMAVWVRFHHYWWTTCRSANVPLLVVRFEDLLKNPVEELTKLLCFARGEAEMSDFWVQRIRQAVCHTTCNQPPFGCTSLLGSYRPRSAVGGAASIGKSLRKQRYSDELLRDLHRISRREPDGGELDLLTKFGYDVYQQSFPANFIEGNAPSLECILSSDTPMGIDASGRAVVNVNAGHTVRLDNDPYGRPMRAWRHGHTNKDRQPFQVVARETL